MELPKPKRVRTIKPAPDKSLYERLPLKRRMFVDFYLGKANGCKTKAARMAGYAGPANEGYRLCNDPDVWAYIQDRLKASAMSADEVIARLADHARANVSDYFTIDPETGKWTLDLRAAEEAGLLHLLAEVSETAEGQKVKTVDTQAALVQLGRYHGLFTDKTEGRLKVVSPYEGMTDDELEERARQLRGKTGTAGGDPAPGGAGAA